MNTKDVMSQYTLLSAEERFRLILAASGRDDDAERQKLVNSAQYKNHKFSHHWPYAQAFSELASFTFLELSEEATRYQDLLLLDRTRSRRDEDSQAAGPRRHKKKDTIDKEWLKEFDLLLVAGCILQMKMRGWELFCQKLHVPDRLLWMQYPGYRRLEKMMEISKGMAFVPKGLLRWLNRRRPKGSPKAKHLPISSKKMALDYEEVYRERARWWGAQA